MAVLVVVLFLKAGKRVGYIQASSRERSRGRVESTLGLVLMVFRVLHVNRVTIVANPGREAHRWKGHCGQGGLAILYDSGELYGQCIVSFEYLI